MREATSGTSNATTTTYTSPFTVRDFGFGRYYAFTVIVNNGAAPTNPGLASIDVSTINMYIDAANGAWTASAAKRIQVCQLNIEI